MRLDHRFVLRIAPPHDVSYAGYFYLMARHNGYKQLSTLLNGLCQQLSLQQGDILTPQQPVLLDWLADLLWLEPHALYALTHHPWGGVVTPLTEAITTIEYHELTLPMLPKGLVERRHVRSRQQTQYCPLCLCEAIYHRRTWDLKAVTACPVHHCLLVNRCADCGSTLTVWGIAQGRCEGCGCDLRQAATVDLPDDRLGLLAQAVIAAVANADAALPALIAEHGFPSAPPRMLYRLIDSLQQFAARRPQSRGQHPVDWVDAAQLRAVPGAERQLAAYRAGATAVTALLDWPNGFHALLEQLGGTAFNIEQAFKSLYRVIEGEWGHPGMAFARAAFDALAAERSFSVAECAFQLEMTPEAVVALIEAGELGAVRGCDAAERPVWRVNAHHLDLFHARRVSPQAAP